MTLDGTKNGETRAGATVHASGVGGLDRIDAPDPGADGNANPLAVAVRVVEPGIADRLDPGNHPVLNERVNPARLLAIDVVGHVEVLHGSADRNAVCADVEGVDRRGPADAGQRVRPALLDRVANRRQQP